MNKAALPDLPRVALIAGPTASGKSAIALTLAERTGGVIVNADASQVYADLRVLSARPTTEDEARAPHRLFGHVDGADAGYSAARWAAEARRAIDEALMADRLPILVGGTGLYLRTLLDGIAPVPEIDPAIRTEVRALDVADAHGQLARLDPAAAARLNRADTTRVARALEVVRSTGRPLAAWQAERVGGIGGEIDLVATVLLPPRDWLDERIVRRVQAMLADGGRDEAGALLARPDIPADAPVLRAIGVPEMAAAIRGETSLDEAAARIGLATRQYAKRQLTWFRNQPPPSWISAAETDSIATINNIVTRLHY